MSLKITLEVLSKITMSFIEKVGFKPHPLQEEILKCNSRFLTWVSGARSGKSILAGIMAAAELILPDRRIWVVAPTYTLARKEFDYTLNFLQKYFVKDNAGTEIRFADLCKINVPKEGSCSIKTPFGSFIETKSTENPKALLGEELDTLILAEASLINRDPYERMLVGRIGSRCGRQLAFSTGAGDTGLFADFVDNGDNNIEDWKTFRSTTLVNPYFSKIEYERNKLTLNEKTFNEQFGGELVSKRGLVFNVDLDKIIVKTTQEFLQKIKDLPTFFGVKYKYNNNSSLIFVSYEQVNKIFYIIKEIVGEHRLLEDYAKEVANGVKGLTNPRCYVIDMFDRNTIAEFKRLKLKAVANETIERQLGNVRAIQNRVKSVQRVINENKLFISDRCEKTIDEFKKCKWPDPKKEGTDLLEWETPLPKFFCCLEAISHVICYLEQWNSYRSS